MLGESPIQAADETDGAAQSPPPGASQARPGYVRIFTRGDVYVYRRG